MPVFSLFKVKCIEVNFSKFRSCHEYFILIVFWIVSIYCWHPLINFCEISIPGFIKYLCVVADSGMLLLSHLVEINLFSDVVQGPLNQFFHQILFTYELSDRFFCNDVWSCRGSKYYSQIEKSRCWHGAQEFPPMRFFIFFNWPVPSLDLG